MLVACQKGCKILYRPRDRSQLDGEMVRDGLMRVRRREVKSEQRVSPLPLTG